jgi:LysR family glycine cleavage system transcriptional activator
MRRKIPSLQALACFDAAARHESYTRAAQELALTQSAVSRQITALEEYLGIALFRRTRHGVVLTDAGSQYARQIAPRLQALERDTLDAMSGQGSGGTINLAAVPTFATRWLIPRLPDFARTHPDVTVHIETRTRPFMFAETEFDAALYASTPDAIGQWAGTHAVPLLPEVVLPVCAPGLLDGHTSVTAARLATLPLLQQSTRPHAWPQWLEAAGVGGQEEGASGAPASVLAGPRYEQFSMAAAAAVHGLGVGLIPRLLVEAELASGALVVAHPQPLPEERFYYLVQPESTQVRPALQLFIDWLKRVSTG